MLTCGNFYPVSSGCISFTKSSQKVKYCLNIILNYIGKHTFLVQTGITSLSGCHARDTKHEHTGC